MDCNFLIGLAICVLRWVSVKVILLFRLLFFCLWIDIGIVVINGVFGNLFLFLRYICNVLLYNVRIILLSVVLSCWVMVCICVVE